MTTRVIVCGCTSFSESDLCFSTLDEYLSSVDSVEIVSGHARGADSLGEEYAVMHGLKLAVFKPDWNRYGRAAGPIRNREMLKYAMEEKPTVIAFWNGISRGTKNMISQAERAGVEVKIVSIGNH